MSVALRQTGAMFVDAYRELHARKLFWITLALSSLIVVIFAGLGYDENGLSFFGFRLSFLPFSPDMISKELLYKSLFSTVGIGFWLSWAATILALISTAGFIPEMVSGGAIETMLSKPISRTRLFLTRFATGLMFVALQVAVFSAGAFLVFGLRAGLWEPGIFLAIPIVVVFYSYLFSVCSLVGLLTRSTMTALVVTAIFWCLLFLLNLGDAIFVDFREQARLGVERIEERVASMERGTVEVLREQRGEPDYQPTPEEIEAQNPFLAARREALAEQRGTLNTLEAWSTGFFVVKTVLPKTGETIGLLERHLIDLEEIPEPEEEALPTAADDDDLTPDERVELQRESRLATQEVFRSRSLAWVLGTSLAFEAFVLGLCCLIFSRRDF